MLVFLKRCIMQPSKRRCDLAEVEGPYETFKGSPASEGVLQFDMWEGETKLHYDWDTLKERITRVGLRNSLLMA